MILFKQANAVTSYLSLLKTSGNTIGFVPTMGALHPGHLSLLQQAKKETDIIVCSIFVNPTQFNNPEDFQHYPVTLEQDISLLFSNGCDVLFLPTAVEIYPDGYTAPHYDLGALEMVLEGHYRPGHFQGVCQVVDRLLQIVTPNRIYFGQKDYQQCLVAKRLLSLTAIQNLTLVIAPTVRESDGLAMSSRNLRLTSGQRQKAPALYQELCMAKHAFGHQPAAHISEAATRRLTEKGFRVDYFALADATTLQPLTNASQPAVALVAAYLDNVRLIDNLPLN